MQQETQVIISSTEAAKAADAELNKSVSAQVEQDETNVSEESETTEEQDQAEETEGSETEQEDEADDQEDSKEEEKPKKKNGFKKRIDKLSKRASLAEQERDYWREQALKSQTKQEPQVKDETQAADASDRPKAPRANDFDSYDAYEAARDEYQEKLADWKLDQREKSKEAKSKQVEAKTEYEKSVQSHNERIQEFKKTQTDFDEVVGDFIEDLKAQKIGPTVAVEQAIMDSELGPQIVYELAMKPQEFARINSLSPLAAAREIGKIEARLSKASESQPLKKQTKAPAPISPVGKNSITVAKSIHDPGISFQEYERLRMKELSKK